jgi:hypothetical protein
VNDSRLQYLSRLVDLANDLEDDALRQEIVAFAMETRRILFLSIQAPTVTEVDLLMDEARTISAIHSTFVVFRSTIFPFLTLLWV